MLEATTAFAKQLIVRLKNALSSYHDGDISVSMHMGYPCIYFDCPDFRSGAQILRKRRLISEIIFDRYGYPHWMAIRVKEDGELTPYCPPWQVIPSNCHAPEELILIDSGFDAPYLELCNESQDKRKLRLVRFMGRLCKIVRKS